jgi:hypothetical protein
MPRLRAWAEPADVQEDLARELSEEGGDYRGRKIRDRASSPLGSAVQSCFRNKSSGFFDRPFVKGGLVPCLEEVSVPN